MMGLTRKGEYAIRGMIYLAQQPPGQMALISEIASSIEAPRTFLAKIFQDFVKQGMVKSSRGSGGGFSLARTPATISLREVVEAVEGPILPSRCLVEEERCERGSNCSVQNIWCRIQKKVVDTLEEVTLAELADS